MTRIVSRTIEMMDVAPDGTPQRFRDGTELYETSYVIDRWKESGAWWLGEPQRDMYTVVTVDNSMFDLQNSGGTWSIYRVHD